MPPELEDARKELDLFSPTEDVKDRVIERRKLKKMHLFLDHHQGKYLAGKKWICLVEAEIPFYLATLQNDASRDEATLKSGYSRFLAPAWHDSTKIYNPRFFGRGVGHHPTEAFFSAFRDAAFRERSIQESEAKDAAAQQSHDDDVSAILED